MAGASEAVDWDALLDRLSTCITPQESAAVRQAAKDRGTPDHWAELHDLVAGLLVKHRLTTWPQLHVSFPGYGSHGGELPNAQERASARIEAGEPTVRTAGVLSGQPPDRSSDGNGEGDPVLHEPATLAEDHADEAISSGSLEASAEEPADGNKRRPVTQLQAGTSPAKRANTANTVLPDGRVSMKGRTLADYPRTVQWWHPTKNGGEQPRDYKYASTKRVWLQCPGCPHCGEVHEWDTVANTLTGAGGYFVCPWCAGKRKFCSCRAISANERLAAEWHEDNASPNEVSQGSKLRCKWRCANPGCEHVWVARVDQRSKAGGGSNCSKCAKRRQPE